MKFATNCKAWAIGKQTRHGFNVRRVVWGLLLAQHECREDEEVRAAHIKVEREFKRRKDIRWIT